MIVYRTTSFLQIILILFLRISYVVVALLALYHYNENPFVTVIVAAICVLFFSVTGTDEIVVHTDIVKYKSNSIFKIFRREKQFNIPDIKSIKVAGNYDTGSELHSLKYPKDGAFNKLEIIFKDGRTMNLTTNIYIEKLKKAVSEIKKLSQ